MENIRQYNELLKPVFDNSNEEFKPANEKQIYDFAEKCAEKNVPVSVQKQLAEFYSVTNGVSCLNGFDFHKIEDEILFEWWDSDEELWLGTKDNDVLRWSENKFCLGDASNVSYSCEYKFDSLMELLKKSFNEWNLCEQ